MHAQPVILERWHISHEQLLRVRIFKQINQQVGKKEQTICIQWSCRWDVEINFHILLFGYISEKAIGVELKLSMHETVSLKQ